MRFTRSALVALPLSLLAALPLSAQAQPEMKPGLWEVQVNSPEFDAMRRQLREQLAGMPPAQRAEMEKMMNAQGGGLMSGGPMKVCHTAESLKKSQDTIPGDSQGCTVKPSSKGNRFTFTLSCPDGRTGHGEFVHAGESYKGFVETVEPGTGRKMRMEHVGRWVGSDCGNVKPVEVPTGAARKR